MILRMPDYFSEFACIADKCTDSCCVGWEIDLDDDTSAYYKTVEGEFGERLRANMYDNEDGGCSFRLKEHGRCPLLNSGNLCDIICELGEPAISEVCTDFPRFSMQYGDVIHKCLSFSCMEVCRIVFSKDEPVKIVDVEMPEYGDEYDFDGCDPDEGKEEYEAHKKLMDMLVDRSIPIRERIISCLKAENQESWLERLDTYESFKDRLLCMKELEPINENWVNTLSDLEKYLTEDNYEQAVADFLASPDYNENDIENLMVYFMHRYFFSVAYIKLSVAFTYMVRDMYIMEFVKKNGQFTREDAIRMPRFFSKGVEHAEENLESLRDAILFGDI